MRFLLILLCLVSFLAHGDVSVGGSPAAAALDGAIGSGAVTFDSGTANGEASISVSNDRLKIVADKTMELRPNDEVTLYVAKGADVYSQVSTINADIILEAGTGTLGSIWWDSHGVGDIGKTTRQATPFPYAQGPRDIWLARNIRFQTIGDTSSTSGLYYSGTVAGNNRRLRADFDRIDFTNGGYYVEFHPNAATNKMQTNLTFWLNDGAKQVFYSSSNGTRQAHEATLSSGTVTVVNTTVTANSLIFVSRKTPGGTLCNGYKYSVSAGTSFTITAVQADGTTCTTDTSTVAWHIIEYQ